MNIYGERYAEVGLFIGHCEDLNVRTERTELERYERTGVMFPVARVVYPSEFIVQLDQHEQDGDYGWNGFDKWPELVKLTEKFRPLPTRDKTLTDEELIHCFDRTLDSGGHPYLSVPRADTFRPWSEYQTQIVDSSGQTFGRATADHYYSHWQVHQLHLLQQHPHLHRYAGLVEQLPSDHSFKAFVRSESETTRFRDFNGMRACLDALSFWITLAARERYRTEPGPDEQRAMQGRFADWAALTMKRHQLTGDHLLRFLRQLIHLYEGYERDERYKLARELRNDIRHCGRLLGLAMGKTTEQVADWLGQYDRFDRQTFRYLLAANKERDYAIQMLADPPPTWSRAWQEQGDPDWSFVEADARSLLDYSEQQGLPLLRAGLSGMMAAGHEEMTRKFTGMETYTNLRNVLTGYESLLKEIGVTAERTDGTKTLTRTVRKVMHDRVWIKIFRRALKDPRKLVSGESTADFLDKLETIVTDPALSATAEASMARAFLITCLARNLTAHAIPNESRFFDDAIGNMLNAAITAITYTWKLAQKQEWTVPVPEKREADIESSEETHDIPQRTSDAPDEPL